MSTITRSVSSGPRLDRLAMSRWHYGLTAIITAGLFIDTFELYSSGAVLASLSSSKWSTVSLNATFLFVTFIGSFLGAWFSGVLGDRYGRRFCFQTNLLLFGLASIAGGFAPNMTVLIGLRFIMGLGLGAEIVVGYATLAEFLPAARRGAVITAVTGVVNTSFFISLAMAYFILPTIGWRYMFVIPGVAAMLVWVARKSMPESPRWLESKGRTQEAEAVMGMIEAKASEGRPLASYVPAQTVATQPVSFLVLFSPGVLRNTLVGTTIYVAVGFSIYGFLTWLPTAFVSAGMALGSALQISMVLAAGKTVGAIIGTPLADRLGRKPCIVITSILGAALGVVMAMTAGLAFLVVGFLLACCLGLANSIAFSAYVPELFETRFRLRGTGFCGAAGRLASSLVQPIIVWVLALGGLSAIIGMMAGVLLIQGLVVLVFGTETKLKALDSESVALPVAPALAEGAAF